MTWRAARSLLVLHEQLQHGSRAAPPATDPNSWGLIGDAFHDPESDHSPKDFPGWGDDIVTAADFPNVPDLGLDAHAVLDDIRRSRDPRTKYGISNDQIFSSYATSTRAAWVWGPYNPNDPDRDRHWDHGHLSVVGDSRADGEQPWATIGGPAAAGEDDDMGNAPLGPFELEPPGKVTSLSLPQGDADRAATWLCMTPDTGAFGPVGLRVFASNGSGGWAPVGNGTGLHKVASGVKLSLALPAETVGLSVMRAAVNAGGTVLDPKGSDPGTPYADHLTVCFERL